MTLTDIGRIVVLIGPALLAPSARAAEQVYYVTGSAKMICQLTGLPKPPGTPAGGVFGTDLGFSFEHDGQLYFLFGDTRGGQLNAVDPNVDDSPMKNLDSIATSTALTPNDLCSNLHFVTDSTGTYLPPQIAIVDANGARDEAYQSAGHIGHSTFKIPNSGFSWNNTIYVFFTKFATASKNGETHAGAGYRRTVLASSADVNQVIGGSKGNFKYEFEVSLDSGDGGSEQSGRPLGKFLNLSPIIVNNTDIPGLGLSSPSGQGVLLFAAGLYRRSAPYLAYIPLTNGQTPPPPTGWRYLTGVSGGTPQWSNIDGNNHESEAVPLFSDSGNFIQCIGEMSAGWNPYLHKWLITYNCGILQDPNTKQQYNGTGGIRFHVADHPWGTWSDVVTGNTQTNIAGDAQANRLAATIAPSLIYQPFNDPGYFAFMHRAFQAGSSCTATDADFTGAYPPADPTCSLVDTKPVVGSLLDFCPFKDPTNPTATLTCTHSFDLLSERELNIDPNSADFLKPSFTRVAEGGGEYGSYIIDRFTTGDYRSSTIYFLMSTWNPYQAFLMQSTLRLERPPVAKAGTPQTVSVGNDCMAHVTLDGSGSSDPDGDTLTYNWTWTGPLGSGTASGSKPTVTLPLGATTITLTVSDGFPGVTATDTVVVTTKDTTPPVVRESVGLPALWTPNHVFVNVGLASSATDNCDGARPVTVSVLGNEDDPDPTGDGTFSPDAKNIAPGTLLLRSERKGTGSGRVYLIRSSATDLAGNVGFNCTAVTVPHDTTAASIALVAAQAASASAYCLAHHGAAPPSYFVIGDGPVIGSIQ